MPGTPPSVDYTEAAAVINAALAEGRSATDALTVWSGKPFSTVTNWVHKCRQLGLVPPATKGHRLGGRRKMTVEEIEQRRADRDAALAARRDRIAAQRAEQKATIAARKEREKAALVAARQRERAQAKAARDAQRAAARAERLAAKGVQVVVVHTYVPREGATPAPAVDRSPGQIGNAPRVLACDECDFECEVTRPAELIRHCVQVHRRQPTRAERTPARAPGSVAS